MDTTVILYLVLVCSDVSWSQPVFDWTQETADISTHIHASHAADIQRLESYPTYYDPIQTRTVAPRHGTAMLQLTSTRGYRGPSYHTGHSYPGQYGSNGDTNGIAGVSRGYPVRGTQGTPRGYPRSSKQATSFAQQNFPTYHPSQRQYNGERNRFLVGADASRMRDDTYFRSQMYPKPMYGYGDYNRVQTKNSNTGSDLGLLATIMQRDPLMGLDLPGLSVTPNTDPILTVENGFPISNVDPLAALKLPGLTVNAVVNTEQTGSSLGTREPAVLATTGSSQPSDSVPPLISPDYVPKHIHSIDNVQKANKLNENGKVSIDAVSIQTKLLDASVNHSSTSTANSTFSANQFVSTIPLTTSDHTNNTMLITVTDSNVTQLRTHSDNGSVPQGNVPTFRISSPVVPKTDPQGTSSHPVPEGNVQTVRLSAPVVPKTDTQGTSSHPVPQRNPIRSSTTSAEPVYNPNPMVAWFERFKSGMAGTSKAPLINSHKSVNTKLKINSHLDNQQQVISTVNPMPGIKTTFSSIHFVAGPISDSPTQSLEKVVSPIPSTPDPISYDVLSQRSKPIVPTIHSGADSISHDVKSQNDVKPGTETNIKSSSKNQNVPAITEDLGIYSTISLSEEVQKMAIKGITNGGTLENSKAVLSFGPFETITERVSLPSRKKYMPGSVKRIYPREYHSTTEAKITTPTTDPIKPKPNVRKAVFEEAKPIKSVSKPQEVMPVKSKDMSVTNPLFFGQIKPPTRPRSNLDYVKTLFNDPVLLALIAGSRDVRILP